MATGGMQWVDPRYASQDVLPPWVLQALNIEPQRQLLDSQTASNRQALQEDVDRQAALSAADRGLTQTDGPIQQMRNNLLSAGLAQLTRDRMGADLQLRNQQMGLIPTILNALAASREGIPGAPGGGAVPGGAGGMRVAGQGHSPGLPERGGRGGYAGGGGDGLPDLNDWGPDFGRLGSSREGVWRDKQGNLGGGISGRSVDGVTDYQIANEPSNYRPWAAAGAGAGRAGRAPQLPTGLVPGINPGGLDADRPITPWGGTAAGLAGASAAGARGFSTQGGAGGIMGSAMKALRGGR